MIRFPLVLKYDANSADYIDGWRNRYMLESDGFFYPIESIDRKKFSPIRIPATNVKILSADHKQLQAVSSNTVIFSSSPEQKEKGIGIIDDNEKARTVIQAGDCSDGGAQEIQTLSPQNRQQSQLLSALDDGG